MTDGVEVLRDRQVGEQAGDPFGHEGHAVAGARDDRPAGLRLSGDDDLAGGG